MGYLSVCQIPHAGNGSDLAARAKAGGWYPVLVIGGILVLVAVFVFLVKMRRDG